MRRLLLVPALLLALSGPVACGDTDGPPAVADLGTDDSAPGDDPEPTEPPEGGEGEAGDGELADLLDATRHANTGSFELVDDVTGTGTATGDFQQDPVAFEVAYADDPTLPGGFLVVDGTAYAQQDGETWTEVGDAGLSDDVLVDIGPLPARMLEALLATGEPEVLDAETGGPIFRWTTTGEGVGFGSEYGGAPATVDVQADDEGRLRTLTITQEAADESAPGGTFTITFDFDAAAPPITAPPDPEPLDEG